MPTELTDEQVLSVLGRIEAELNSADQMRLALKQVGVVIQRYREIQPKLAQLVKEEQRLREMLAGLGADIESQRRAGAERIQKEADDLHKQMHDRIEPLRIALEEASARVVKAESLAVEAEAASTERIKSASSAAEAVESRLVLAEAKLQELGNLTRR